MKQIIAIIRNEQVDSTKAALDAIGVRGITFLQVTGRGQQKGRISAREMVGALNRNIRMQLERARPQNFLRDAMSECVTSPAEPSEEVLHFIPKRMLIIITIDDEINRIIQTIINANQTGHHGDGRIFICPIISALRIRTGEQGVRALL